MVIRFSGDSGDGMQLTGTLFSDTAALQGNGISTFPDYPAEIRAPQGTVAGVSGFQVHFGDHPVQTPGDYCDVLVTMNPAALRANACWLRKGATVIIDGDTLDEKSVARAGFTTGDPFAELGIEDYNIIVADITTMTKEALAGLDLDVKSVVKCKNMFALGMCLFMFNKPLEHAVEYINNKFGKRNPVVARRMSSRSRPVITMPTIRMRSPIRTTCSLPTCPRVVTAASTATRRRHGDSSPLPKRAAGRSTAVRIPSPPRPSFSKNSPSARTSA